MSQAFISYHRAQGKLARLMAHRIAAEGHSVWWDRGERPGDNWSEAVSTALANSACIVVIWSKQALSSPFVLGEATAGFGRNALVNVTSDSTQVPAPFNKAPCIDLSDWSGEPTDLAWIRLREPLRARLAPVEPARAAPPAHQPTQPAQPAAQAAARTLQPSIAIGESVEGDLLPPQRRMDPPPLLPPRPPPTYRTPSYDPPPTPTYRERRGGVAASTLALLVLGGAAALGWQQRDSIQTAIDQWQSQSGAEVASDGEATPDATSAPQAGSQLAAADPAALPDGALTAPEGAVAPLDQTPLPAPGAPAPPQAAAGAAASVEAPRMTYDWRDRSDGYVPPPTLRTIPRPAEPAPAPHSAAPAAAAPVATMEAPAASVAPIAVRTSTTFVLRQGSYYDLDTVGAKRETDVYFAPDRTGYGLFLGVANGARLRPASGARVSVKSCSEGIMRRTPIAVRELQNDGGVCIRSSEGIVTAWRVDGFERQKNGSTLTLKPVAE